MGDGDGRYRLQLSDGEALESSAMLSSHLNHMVRDGLMVQYDVIKVLQFAVSPRNRDQNGQTYVL